MSGWRASRWPVSLFCSPASALPPHCNGNSVYIFTFWEQRGLSPNFHIHVSVSDIFIPRIGPHISFSRTGRPIVGIYNSLTDTWMWKLGLRPQCSFSGNICFKFSAFCLCSARFWSSELSRGTAQLSGPSEIYPHPKYEMQLDQSPLLVILLSGKVYRRCHEMDWAFANMQWKEDLVVNMYKGRSSSYLNASPIIKILHCKKRLAFSRPQLGIH